MTKSDNGGKLEENNALMANGRAKPEKTSFTTFIYNKREGKFLGRTGKSWAQIVFFYIIFYICLAAFWVACLAIFLQTIDPATPRYYGKDTIIGDSPGVGYQPWLKDDPESTLIKFNTKDKASYAHYVQAMDNYLAKYSNTNNTRKCDGKDSNQQITVDGNNAKAIQDAKACQFELKDFNNAGCGKDKGYGFADGQPCIILSLNRLIGWLPKDYADGNIPDSVRSRYKAGNIAFYCNGSSDIDQEVIGPVQYVPPHGIDGRFYPYMVMDNYHQPIAMVKFTGLKPNRLVMVECSAFADNIEQDAESRSGMVTFELLMQDTDEKNATSKA